MNKPQEKMSKAAYEMAKAAEDMNKAAEDFDKAAEEMKVLEKETAGADQGTDTVACSDKTGTVETRANEDDYTEAGDIGDEQMPAGDIKTDKKVWNYDASKNKIADLPKKVKDFVAGL